MSQNSKVKIPEQLQGSGTVLIDMHPEQYIIDGLGDKILLYNSYGQTPEEIAAKISTPDNPFSVARVKTFLTLAKRKIWHQLTGECIRDSDYLTRKIDSVLYYARTKEV